MKYLLIIFSLLLSACGSQSYIEVIKGEPGPTGTSGINGTNGLDGTSCSAATLPLGDPSLPLGGAVISCNGQTTLVSNGAQGNTGATGVTGPTGPQGQSAYSISMVIDPCGSQGSYDEVLLAFSNGSLVALFTANMNGDYPRFSLIPDGSYLTSDATSCYFSVSTSSNTRTVTWSGGSQSWSVQ